MTAPVSFRMIVVMGASYVVRAGLRLLEEQETKLAALRAALVAGEGSGVSQRSVQEIWAAVKERSDIARG
jgi:Arc/MetJ-type ribon-helix-helix transcriptional regulator